jgi:hypothetical protein
MKPITLIIGLLVVGCGNSDKVKLLEEENKRLKAEANVKLLEEKLEKAEEATPTAKPTKELTAEEKKVVGTYEVKKDGNTLRIVLLENGVFENYVNGKKLEYIYKWSISEDGELQKEDKDEWITIYSINKDESITWIAEIDGNGERTDMPKKFQDTYKKTK